ncbi:EamA family transporter [Niabella sp. CC-SYL272]|uniref:DMT family transporter n=1 Tax=Niabella agricola TaxID=2891571 RepID=UPI001F26F460|nr:EamA family transporter [Niabella agricola]MCF3109101.1 EamA family transporter [Niabella agricola]
MIKQHYSHLKKNHPLKGILLALSGASLWGISGTFSQFLFQQRNINVEWLMAMRMLVSGVLLLAFSGMKKNNDLWKIWQTKKDRLQLSVFGLTGMLAVQYTYFAAIRHSNAATATVLQYAGPVMIAGYLALKNKKVPTRLECFAILLAVSGTFLLVTHGKANSLNISKTALVLGIASAVALAIYTLQPVALLKKYSSATVIGWGLLIGGVAISFIKAPWQAEGIWDGYTYSYTLFVILLGTLVPFYAYLSAVKIIGGQKASLLASAEPLSATVIAVLWLQVPFGLTDWIGSGLIIATVFLLSRKARNAAPPTIVGDKNSADKDAAHRPAPLSAG